MSQSNMQTACLIVGLGNPGQQYQLTRHNFGFLAIDYLLEAFSKSTTVRELSSSKDSFSLYRMSLSGKQIYLMKPLTFMNKSGEALQGVCHYYKILSEQLLVLHDELDIGFGEMRLKFSGGIAGHNGLRSIQQHMGTSDFTRIRLGIGKPLGYDTASFVLSKFSQEELNFLPTIFTKLDKVCHLLLQGEKQKAQQLCNSAL